MENPVMERPVTAGGLSLVPASQARANTARREVERWKEAVVEQVAELEKCVQRMYRIIEHAVQGAVDKGAYTVSVRYYSSCYDPGSPSLFGVGSSTPHAKAQKVVGAALKARGYKTVWRARQERLEIEWKP